MTGYSICSYSNNEEEENAFFNFMKRLTKQLSSTDKPLQEIITNHEEVEIEYLIVDYYVRIKKSNHSLKPKMMKEKK